VIGFKFAIKLKTRLFSCFAILIICIPSWADTLDTRTHIEDKLYRQALYYYFSGNYSDALRQISINRHRYDVNTARSYLFEAGLNINMGLHYLAAEALNEFDKKQLLDIQNDGTSQKSDKGKSNTSADELLLIAQLQLAEQHIQQGNNDVAQKTLSNIKKVPLNYDEQYHTLSQLAYWPQSPPLSATKNKLVSVDHQASRSAYINLNSALLHIERDEYEKAESILMIVKNKQWQLPSKTFWQLLFNPLSDNTQNNKPVKDEQLQQQAVNDYAQLLLAQMYVKQGSYESAYNELKGFPQDSQYTESALFIFAFSALKTQHHSTSIKLLDLMSKRYPYSNLGWQASLMLAAKVTNQMTLAQGVTSYQNAQDFYQQQLQDLNGFKSTFLSSKDLLSFAAKQVDVGITDFEAKSALPIFGKKSYITDSHWLQKALLDAGLQADYQALIELELLNENLIAQQNKNQWLQSSLDLNKQRKLKVLELQNKTDYQVRINKLRDKKNDIAKVVSQAKLQQQGNAFANLTQKEWLKRIEQSKTIIASIKEHKNTNDYQQRLTRIEGVLSWQLQNSLPERLWQHTKLLNKIDKQLILIEQQRNNFIQVSGTQPLLNRVENRIQINSSAIIIQLNKVAQLKATMSEKIRGKVQSFVEIQKDLLEQHVLQVRHEMAAILEKMAKTDKSIKLKKNYLLHQANIQSELTLSNSDLKNNKESL